MKKQKTMDKEQRIPLKTIKRIIKHHTNKEVSNETCEYVRNMVENNLKELSYEIKEELEELNSLRSKCNLPKLKRIKLDLCKNLITKKYKPCPHFDNSKLGNYQKCKQLTCKADAEVI